MPRFTDRDSETVTYVREGSLAYEDSSGSSGVIQAGEFQRSTIGRGAWYRAENPSRTDSAQVFRASIRASQVGPPPGHERRRFSVAERRGGLCVIASQDARKGSLRLHQDALDHSALLNPGQHVAYELCVGRSAWVHVVDGEITLAGIVLTTGDGAGVQGERAVSFTATEEAEVLLLDVGDEA
jgi:redox-sensitive bicupin YhaK (pirin superfamily)